ncbi:MAG: hypothetical protein NTW21_10565 [Verrucomicrobia bacterium]|nr:hypothetical protein [Verrucomicrobiota bacterium]
MKPSLTIPVLTTLIGFGLGWMAKPSANPAPGPTSAATCLHQATDRESPAVVPPTSPPPPPSPPRPDVRPNAGGPAAEVQDDSARSTEPGNAAKMLRLAEALGLSDEQQADLKHIIAESLKAFNAGNPAQPPRANAMLDQFASSATAIEKSLGTLLTPEQCTAFAQLRKRQLDNRIETRAQRDLGSLTEVTDLSPEQRDQVLAQLRQSTAAELGAMPAPLALILDSSVLPLGSLAPSEQSIQTLRQLADSQTPDNPAALHAKLVDNQRRTLDARLRLLKDILTPAQLAQYQATIDNQHAIHNLMLQPQR